MANDNHEIEVKIRIGKEAIPRLREKAGELGFQKTSELKAEKNILFDFADGRLKASGQALRLRQYGDDSWITYKGPKVKDPLLKIRLEEETSVGDFGTARRILEQLGLEAAFRYDKEREKYRLKSGGKAVELSIDQTPVGCFVEIEGSRELITQFAGAFGWSEEDFLNSNYVDLYAERGLGS